MAVAAEKKQELQEVAEILAKSRKLFKDHAVLTDLLTKQAAALKSFDVDLVYLLNAQDALAKATKDAEARIAQTEREVKTKLMDVEQGHRALIESLSNDKIEVQKKQADLEKRERNAAALEQKYTLLCDQKERELNAVKTIKK